MARRWAASAVGMLGVLASFHSAAQTTPIFKASDEVVASQSDRDVAVGVLMQKYSDTTARLDGEKEKATPDPALVERLSVELRTLEGKILALQQGEGPVVLPSVGPAVTSPTAVLRPPPTAPSPVRYESWDVFKNFGTEGSTR